MTASTRGNNDFTILHEFPTPELERAWRDCLSRVELPSHYNSPEIFLEPRLPKYFIGTSPFAVLAFDQGRVVGVLTGQHEGDHVMAGIPSRPQICLDKTADSEAALDALARGLLAEADSARLISVYSWISLPLEPFKRYGFRFRQLQGDVVLDLTQGSEALFGQFSHQKRRHTRRAIRCGVEVCEASSTEDILAAYYVYLAWRRFTSRKRIEGEEIPFAFFEQACRLTGNRRLLLARFAGKAVAFNIVRFFPGGLVESSENSSLPEFLHMHPNELLQLRELEWACREGFPRDSLGGAHAFLRKFGGTIVPICRYRLDRTWIRRHDLREAMLDRGREALRKLPDPVEKTVRRLLGRERPAGW